MKRKRPKPPAATPNEPPPEKECVDNVFVSDVVSNLAAGKHGSLSDKLNPDSSNFDPELKARWKELPKKQRKVIIDADAGKLHEIATQGAAHARSIPFQCDPDDHCESPPEAYADIASSLDLIASRLGKTRANLVIYDPFYCAGSMKKHLGTLGNKALHRSLPAIITAHLHRIREHHKSMRRFLRGITIRKSP